MFPNFRVFFVFVFQYNVFVYVAPLLYWIRYVSAILCCALLMTSSDHVDLVVWLQIGIIATFKAYPSAGDVAFFLSFIPLFYHKIQRTLSFLFPCTTDIA